MAMDELNITSAYVHMLILKARAVMVKEGLVTPEGKHAFDRLLSEMITDRHRS